MAGAAARSSPIHVRFGEFELDEANALLLRGGSSIALSPTPFGLLCALARRPGTLLTKHALLDEVWGHQFVSDSVLKGAISDVRTALDDDPHEPRFIETVPRRGYRFIAVSTGRFGGAAFLRARRQCMHRHRQINRRTIHSSVEPKNSHTLRRAWDRVERWQARRILDCRRARHWQDNADRSLYFRTRRRFLAREAIAYSTMEAASRITLSSKPSRSCVAMTPRSRLYCALSRRPGCCNSPGSVPRNNAKPCCESLSESIWNGCCARWANSWTATPRGDDCCW